MQIFVILLIAAVLCVPLAHRLKLGAIPGYLAAGLLVGPSGFNWINDVPVIMNVSESGVVMMLFVIGLELSPERLWRMRREVFVIGTLQMVFCGVVLGALFGLGLRNLVGLGIPASILCGLSLALSSTAVAMRLLDERSLEDTGVGRSALGILLFQDMAAMPMLIAAGLLGEGATQVPSGWSLLVAAAVIGVSYKLRLLDWAARTRLPEMFTASTLLVVLGSAYLFDAAGVSAGLGGFLVGVLLAKSRYRARMEETIEPFKGLLLGLFFLAIGMSINLEVVRAHWVYICMGVTTLIVVKGAILYGLARALRLDRRHQLMFAMMLAQGGEFSFAIFAEAQDNGLMSIAHRDVLSVIVAISMGVVPLMIRLMVPPSHEDLPAAAGATAA
jgi:monovalent cation:proton antiporter-2 (CPA2) family protein